MSSGRRFWKVGAFFYCFLFEFFFVIFTLRPHRRELVESGRVFVLIFTGFRAVLIEFGAASSSAVGNTDQ